MSSDFNEIANTPIEMELAGKRYKVRRLSLNVIFGMAESAVISSQMKIIRQIAEGLSSDEKVAYLAKATLESIPTGVRLNQMTAEYLKSVAGVKMVLIQSMKADQPEIENELANIEDIINSNKDDVAAIVVFATSGKAGKKETSPFPETQKGQRSKR